ncbi:nicotinamide phosphoribosyltransferase [Aeromonas phage Akh-2]|nr:nicotinamide phosphoribosyltransferase [Aeromonas phage Akh-2]
MQFTAALMSDVYKTYHPFAYHPLSQAAYENFTNRSGKLANIPDNAEVLFVGLQYFIKEILIKRWKETFFCVDKSKAIKRWNRMTNAVLGKKVPTSHMEALWDLGYLPIEIKAVEEGTLVPYGVPSLTIESTVEGFHWVPGMLETVMSAELWGICTSATTAFAYRRQFEKTPIAKDVVKFMGHDFSYRGMFGTQAAAMSGFGHLCSFYGSDTYPAAEFAEEYYNADVEKELVMASVDATEHSVMCSYGNEGEMESLRHLMTNVTPTGILSVVSDTWDFWKLVGEYLPALKDEIMAREGTLVIRPDSGDPVDILCGLYYSDVVSIEEIQEEGTYFVENTGKFLKVTKVNEHGLMEFETISQYEVWGLIESLWNIFGGTLVDFKEGRYSNTFKMLDSHVGAIYGDSITLERQRQIHRRLMKKGFVPSVVLGIGSFTYQYVTRDTHGSAMKATAVKKEGEWTPIFKDPKTDSKKKSAKGFLYIGVDENGRLYLEDNVTREREAQSLLTPVFKNGKLLRETSLAKIRAKIDSYL